MNAPDDGDEEVIELAPCEDCGHLVPPANLEMHRLRGCPNRKRPAAVRGRQQDNVDLDDEATRMERRRDPPQNPNFVLFNQSYRTAPASGIEIPVVQGRTVQDGPGPPGSPCASSPAVSSDLMLLDAPVPASFPLTAYNCSAAAAPSAAPVASTAAAAAATASSPSSWERIASTFQNAVSGLASSIANPPGESALARRTESVAAETTASYPASRRRRPRGGNATTSASMKSPPGAEVIDLLDSPETAASAPAAATQASQAYVVDFLNYDSDDGWSCPRCTLANPGRQSVCEACLYHRPGGITAPFSRDTSSGSSSGSSSDVRSPNATRTDQLVPPAAPRWQSHQYLQENHNDDNDRYASYLSPSPNAEEQIMGGRSFVGSGAILGGVLGAAGALARGRPVARGAIDGAFGGAVGGMAVEAILQRGDRQPYSSASRSSGQRHQQRYQSQFSYQQPQPVQNTRTLRLPNGATVTLSTGGRYGTTSIQQGPDPRMMEMLLHQSLMAAMIGQSVGQLNGGQMYGAGGGGGGGGGSGATYEQLLQMFGDGTDNLGAQDGQIDALPTATVTSENLKKGQCSICLQEFDVGDSFRTLPCLHSDFHTACIDQWLKTNAACPICKHRVDE